jgi:hypothetical protein
MVPRIYPTTTLTGLLLATAPEAFTQTYYFSNDMTATRYGNTTYFSDGTSANHYGNTTYWGTATRYGNTTYFNNY